MLTVTHEQSPCKSQPREDFTLHKDCKRDHVNASVYKRDMFCTSEVKSTCRGPLWSTEPSVLLNPTMHFPLVSFHDHSFSLGFIYQWW